MTPVSDVQFGAGVQGSCITKHHESAGTSARSFTANVIEHLRAGIVRRNLCLTERLQVPLPDSCTAANSIWWTSRSLDKKTCPSLCRRQHSGLPAAAAVRPRDEF